MASAGGTRGTPRLFATVPHRLAVGFHGALCLVEGWQPRRWGRLIWVERRAGGSFAARHRTAQDFDSRDDRADTN
jgi:hypothetical protein